MLFKNIAEIYAASRPSYPKKVFDIILEQLPMTHNQLYADLGCGTGELLIPLSKHFQQSVGVDSEQDMLSVAARKVLQVSSTIELVHSKAENYLQHLSEDKQLDLVTAGRSFHWMDSDAVVDELMRRLRYGGVFAVLGEAQINGGLWRRKSMWAQAVRHIIFDDFGHKEPFVPPMTKVKATFQERKDAMARLGNLREFIVEVEQEWTINTIIDLFYSAANFLVWLGEDKALFEDKVSEALYKLESSGVFITPSQFGVMCVVHNRDV